MCVSSAMCSWLFLAQCSLIKVSCFHFSIIKTTHTIIQPFYMSDCLSLCLSLCNSGDCTFLKASLFSFHLCWWYNSVFHYSGFHFTLSLRLPLWSGSCLHTPRAPASSTASLSTQPCPTKRRWKSGLFKSLSPSHNCKLVCMSTLKYSDSSFPLIFLFDLCPVVLTLPHHLSSCAIGDRWVHRTGQRQELWDHDEVWKEGSQPGR